jgi:hypothetical protein
MTKVPPMTPTTPTLEPVPDFRTPAARDIRTCAWWRPCTVALLPRADGPAAGFLRRLGAALRDHGHRVHDEPVEGADVFVATATIPDGRGPLQDRIPELARPLLFETTRGLRRRPADFITAVAVGERLSAWPHAELVETARAAMARLGTPKVVFVTVDRAGVVTEATTCTMEGGHPTDRERIPERVRDRIVTAACAREVGGRYRVEGGLPAGVWTTTRIPDALVAAGRRMDTLGLLPPPRRISEYVSRRSAELYRRFLGLKGFSEGMLFAYDPGLGAMLVTASGSWDVDKRALRRDEVVAVAGFEGDRLRVLAVDGAPPKGPSVEAWEMLALLESVPRVRVVRDTDGCWVPAGSGPGGAGAVEVPIVRGGIHVHVGITAADPALIESVPANRERFPYGFGCGTDLMCDVARDAALRSRAISDAGDPRSYVRWPMLYHGDTLVELWKPGVAAQPLDGLLDLFDPDAVSAIAYAPDHIDQPA